MKIESVAEYNPIKTKRFFRKSLLCLHTSCSARCEEMDHLSESIKCLRERGHAGTVPPDSSLLPVLFLTQDFVYVDVNVSMALPMSD